MRHVELHHGAASDAGRVGATNRDAWLTEPPVYLVADGTGGRDGGEVASRIVADELARLARDGYDEHRGPDVLRAALLRCWQQIKDYDAGRRRAGALQFHSASTAVVAAVVEADGVPAWLVANVGDSRAYRFDEGRLNQVSVDHSRAQELRAAGRVGSDALAEHPERDVVTRVVGGPRPPEPDFFTVPLPRAERLLLVTDGVVDVVGDDEIAAVLARCPDPRDAADRLVAAARAAGGVDNATAVVVDVVGLASESVYDSARQRLSLEQKLGVLP